MKEKERQINQTNNGACDRTPPGLQELLERPGAIVSCLHFAEIPWSAVPEQRSYGAAPEVLCSPAADHHYIYHHLQQGGQARKTRARPLMR